MSTSMACRQKLQKVADVEFVEGRIWKKWNFWSKNDQKSIFSPQKIEEHVEARNFCEDFMT